MPVVFWVNLFFTYAHKIAKSQSYTVMIFFSFWAKKQNENDQSYVKMSSDYDRSIAFQTACELIFEGKEQPSGYTEPLLHLNRLNMI